MSLTYDGGKTFHKIAEYTRSCPDFHYEWPVKIPDNVPSCDTLGQCLFIWSWTAYRVPQFYMNCADVVIQGRNKTGVLPKEGIQIVNADGFEKGVTSLGDDTDKIGNGPNPDEVGLNLGLLRRILPSAPSILPSLSSLPVIRLS
ncbi:MAG: hypothetical protein J3Q66DRAFT_337339 [Benniella sp.]|nr:MAG: hypothetical protein J3Q66DRAFT_337339 [Benniella sp.]